MWKNKIKYLLLLVGLFFLMVMYEGWQTKVMFEGLCILPLVSALLYRTQEKKLLITPDTKPVYALENQEIRPYLFLKNRSGLPFSRIAVTVEAEDYLGNKQNLRFLVQAKRYESVAVPMILRAEHYGRIRISIKKIELTDLFGLSHIVKKGGGEAELFIYPPYESELSFSFYRNLIQKDESGMDTSIVDEKNRSEVLQIREYREGDALRDIHWKLSAKNEVWQVKEFAAETTKKLWICIDAGVEEILTGADAYMELLQPLLQACDRAGIGYALYLWDGKRIEETDFSSFATGLIAGTQTEKIPDFDGQTGIFLTQRELPEEAWLRGMTCLQAEPGSCRRESYALGEKTLFRVIPEQTKRDEKGFVRLMSDAQTWKQRKKDGNRKVQGLPAGYGIRILLALLASLLSVLSIYDLVYVEQETFLPVATVLLFLAIHVISYGLTRGEEGGKIDRWRTGLLLAGYPLILLAGGCLNPKEGIGELVGYIRGTIMISGDTYGLTDVTSGEAGWLLVFMTYAIVDVFFHFSLDFIPQVHLLIVIPLLSIAYLVGAIPSGMLVVLSMIYFPLFFAYWYAMRYGRTRSAKEETIETGRREKIASQAGMLLVILTTALTIGLCLLQGSAHYERAQWMSVMKRNINARLVDISSGTEGNRTSNMTFQAHGSLDDSQEITYTGDTALTIALEEGGNQEKIKAFYLKCYAGTVYTGSEWKERSVEERVQEKAQLARLYHTEEWDRDVLTLSYRLAGLQEQQYYIAGSPRKQQNVLVISRMEDDRNIYLPYFADMSHENGGVDFRDGYIRMKESSFFGTGIFFLRYQMDDVEDFSSLLNDAGQVTEENALSDEEKYGAFVREHYLEVPEELQALLEPLGTVDVGTQGYEAAIYKVRSYFVSRGFQYKLDAVKATDEDFIRSFLYRKTGYCIHYASAAVMMFRSMGIPARYAEGFVVKGSDYTETLNHYDYYEVPDRNAHAWVEIYENGVGWVPVEVTPGAENFTLTPQQGGTNQDRKEETTKKTEQKRTEPKQTETKDEQEKKPSGESVKINASDKAEEVTGQSDRATRFIFVTELLAVLFLISYGRYRICRYVGQKRLSDTETFREEYRQRMTYLQLQLKLIYTGMRTNRERASALAGRLREGSITQEEAEMYFALLDRMNYAQSQVLSEEEYDFLKNVLKRVTEQLLEESGMWQKIRYKYIKCLYLFDK